MWKKNVILKQTRSSLVPEFTNETHELVVKHKRNQWNGEFDILEKIEEKIFCKAIKLT